MQVHMQTTHSIHARQVQKVYIQGHIQIHSQHMQVHMQTVYMQGHMQIEHTTHANSTHARAAEAEGGMCTWVVSNASPVGEPNGGSHSAQLHQEKP